MNRLARGLSAERWGLAVGRVVGLASFLTAASVGWAADSISPLVSASDATAEELVQRALAAELQGDAAGRASLLNSALLADETRPESNWQAGRVKLGGKWLRHEEAEQAAAEDKDRAEYLRLRDQADDSAESHRQLAKWCRDHGLEKQEEFHLKQLLSLDPGDKLAQKQLGVRPFDGRLATDDEIAAATDEDQQRLADLKKFKSEFKSWLGEALRGDDETRQAVLQRFREVRDVAALPALEAASRGEGQFRKRFLTRMGKDEGAAYWNELCQGMLHSVAAIPDYEATHMLAETAVFSTDAALRDQAAAALRERRPTDYMPLLLGTLASLIEADIDVSVSPAGDVSFLASYKEDGVGNQRRHIDSFDAITVLHGEVNASSVSRFRATVATQANRAQGLATAARNRVAAINEERQLMNGRIIAALRQITQEDLGEDPAAWRERWAGFNDMYYPEEKPIEETATNSVDYQYVYGEPTITSAQSPQQPRRPIAPHPECFAVGTLVWTDAGPERIELLRPGDFVLSQDPLTGELAYKPIVDVTVRPPTKFIDVKLSSGEHIHATRGHRFWVDGEGWCMARFLKPGLTVHGVDGGMTVEEAELFDGDEAYNLVVDDFHTYFVGQSKALVHDTNCPAPTLAPIPGMKGERAIKSLASGLTP